MTVALLADIETTGVTPSDQGIEVGAVLYSLRERAILATYSDVVRHREPRPNGALHVNGLTDALRALGAPPEAVWSHFLDLLERAEVLVFYNAPFDRRYLPFIVRQRRPIVCAMREMRWLKPRDDDKLPTLAKAYGVNTDGEHRAFGDALMLAGIFRAAEDEKGTVEQGLRRAARLPR